jgi:hypothetical protein
MCWKVYPNPPAMKDSRILPAFQGNESHDLDRKSKSEKTNSQGKTIP